MKLPFRRSGRSALRGLRAKLILLFVVIKVVPLVLLAVLAWEGVTRLGGTLSERTDGLTGEANQTVAEMGRTFSQAAEKALDDRAREELERLTTDTARAVADFLHDRDRDILLAAQMEPGADNYRRFVAGRLRGLVDSGRWQLAADGKQWVAQESGAPAVAGGPTVQPSNVENRQDFHYRPPEQVQRSLLRPLYHEITYVGLDGREKFKIANTRLLPKALLDVSKKENTYCKAEGYFPELHKLKPGEIYVSDVIGPYVGSRVIGALTPDKARSLQLPYAPEQEAYAGRENPLGKRFQGIVRWATPVLKAGRVVGYVTLALDHSHVMSFTDNLLPTNARYTAIADASNGNYAFIWDYRDRNIAHPRHYSVFGFDPATGQPATPWLDAGLYEQWQRSGKPIADFLAEVPAFDHQSRDKKPAKALTAAGLLGLDCRYLNFAPQCQGWHDLTEHGGSGSFLIEWAGVWKLTTAATIPYRTGHYGDTPRGFGYVTIGANIDEFHRPAAATAKLMNARLAEFGLRMKQQQASIRRTIGESLGGTALELALSTALMIGIVVAIAIWLASLLTRRLTALIAGLRQIEQGDLSFRFAKTSDDELGQLSESLNHMADSMQESFQRLGDAKHQAEEASRLKSDFLASMSHELRTPLNGILGFAELIELDASEAEIRDHAGTIHKSGEHLLTLVNDILDLAKIEAGHMTLETADIDLPALLDEIAALHRGAAQAKELSLHSEFAADLPPLIQGDPTRLRQIINNLLDNAVKFTASGEIKLAARSADGRLYIAVSDTGTGIDANAQALIFEKFRQADAFINREYGGSGLGLALVREFLLLMGGEIHLHSQPGQGSTFEFSLPLTAEVVAAA